MADPYPVPDRAAYAAYKQWRSRPNRDAYVHDTLLGLATDMFEAGRVAEAQALGADLRTVLDQRMMHSHQRPGVWDDDNSPEIAGTACVECAARARLEALLAGVDRG